MVAKWLTAALLVVLVSATGGSVWWWVGDVSEVPPTDDGYYMWHPPRIGAVDERRLGVVSVVLLVTAALLFAVTPARRAWRATLPAVALGLFCGWGYRVMTAAVHGANIGGGMVMLIGLVYVPLMAAGTVGLWARAYPPSPRLTSRRWRR